MTEESLYGPVAHWLGVLLKQNHPRCRVQARDTHRISLNRVIREAQAAERFPQSELWDIKVDVVGMALGRSLTQLILVECKVGRPGLRDVCQLLGYCRVVKPAAALLVSPAPISDRLAQLLLVHGRYDILEYDQGRRLRLERWVEGRNEVDPASVLPPGEHLLCYSAHSGE